MSNSILASLRESFPSSEFTIAATSGGSTTVATNLYYWVNGYSRGGMNLLTSLGRVAVSIGQKLVFTVTAIAPGDDVFGFILSASETNDATTAKILAIAPARASNQETLIPAPLVVNLTHDSHFGLGISSALPTSNLINGMIRYADGQYQQYSSQLNTWEIVNGWGTYLTSTTSPLTTGIYKNGCDVPILSNESIIPLADYTGGTSTRFRLALQNGLEEGSGSILSTGSKVVLNILLDGNDAIAAQYLNEGNIQINPVHVVRRSDGTVTSLDNSTLTWEWGVPFYTLASDLLRGYAIAFDVTVVNATLPQGSDLIFYLSEYGRISEKVQSTGSGSLVYAEGDRLRIYPAQVGILRGTGNGLIEVTGETYSYPVNATSRNFFGSGLQSNTADQIVAISGLSNGDITFRANTNQLLATEAVRAIVSTVAVTVTPSAWVSVGSVTANQLINVTVNYPCDTDGIGTIRSDYPDVITGSAIGEFNPDKLRVFLRKNGTTITETTAIAVTPGTSQGFTITSIGTSATLPATTASDIGFWDYGSISTTKSGNSSDLTAGTYEICIAYQYEGNTVVSISHAIADGCITELTSDLATAIAKSDYFSEVYQSGTLKPQVTGLNFANNWFTVAQNGSNLDVSLTGVSRLWPVATPPDVNFDFADGVRAGDSARLAVSPYTIYDCLDATVGDAVWVARGDVVESANFAALPGTGETGKIYITLDDNKTYRWSGSVYVEVGNPFSGSYNDLTDKPTLATVATSGSYNDLSSKPTIPTAASGISVSTTNFNTNLSSADDTVQKALDTLDDLIAGAGGHTIQNEGTPLTARTNLNFIGTAVTATDNSGADSTDVTINLPTTGSGLNLGTWDDSGTFTSGVRFDGSADKVILPKATTAERTAITPLASELIYDTNLNQFFYGDGTTVGGKAVGSTTVADNVFRIQDNTDATKQIAFEASGITTATTRTLTSPDASGTIALIDTTGLSDKDLFYYDSSSKLFKRIAIGTTDQALLAKPSSNPPYQFGTVASSGGGNFTVVTADTTVTDSTNYLTPSSGMTTNINLDASNLSSPQGKCFEIVNENATYKPCLVGGISLDGVPIPANKGIFINTSGKKAKFVFTTASKDIRQLWGDTPTIDWKVGYTPPQPEGTIIAMTLNNTLTEYNGLTATNSGLTFDTGIKPNANWTASLKYTGSSQYLTVPYNANQIPGSQAFCIEFLIRIGANTDFAYTGNLDNSNQYPMIRFDYKGQPAVLWGNGSGWATANDPAAPSAMSLNVWHHVALTKSSTTATLYIDGTSVDTATVASNLPTTTQKPWAIIFGGYNQTMYICNYRYVVGQVVYTGNFTPSYDPFVF